MNWKYDVWYKEKTKTVVDWSYSIYLDLYGIVFIITVNPYGVRTFQYDKDEFIPDDDIDHEVTNQHDLIWLNRISSSGLFIDWEKL